MWQSAPRVGILQTAKSELRTVMQSLRKVHHLNLNKTNDHMSGNGRFVEVK